ncbi:uncharacterized protein LOC115622175 isoform X2 [Scaptodrosophila lebanonensis]|uniref:Uncharacterized protein LOC115622175 isoform X2 n=1 Tax=Drosophila lebanonensis TaxID=7225 RepID=A0A6J2T7C8_DROLE|nr:uncharacterized protein LOC115622175 isoform X2 [Scaptodrosophila lebanonensis]
MPILTKMDPSYDPDENPEIQSTKRRGKKRAPSKKFRPTITKIWSYSNCLKLIELVKQSPSLWNSTAEEYANQSLKSADWHYIYEQFKSNGYSKNDLIAKWNSLRTSYRRRHVVFAENSHLHSPWKFYKEMAFIGPILTSRKKEISVINAATSPSGLNQHLPSTASTSMIKNEEQDRNSIFTTFLLSELRTLPEQDADLLRCRLHRTLLEFNEELNHRKVEVECDADIKFEIDAT